MRIYTHQIGDCVGLWSCNRTVYEQMMTALTRRSASRLHTRNRRLLGTLYPRPTPSLRSGVKHGGYACIQLKYASDQFDHASLENAITAQIGDRSLPVGPLELQIAYKLYLDTQKDFEDAVHLFVLFEESLRIPDLEEWVQKLDVKEEYERLRSA